MYLYVHTLCEYKQQVAMTIMSYKDITQITIYSKTFDGKNFEVITYKVNLQL